MIGQFKQRAEMPALAACLVFWLEMQLSAAVARVASCRKIGRFFTPLHD
jgi:hypothetical protein